MSQNCFLNYYWSEGSPKGLNKTLAAEHYYQIVSDPYHKRISVEKFSNGSFDAVVYDSALFDFRLLKPEHQTTWEKVLVEENTESATYLLRDHNARAVIREHYRFQEGLCVQCEAFHPQGTLISTLKLFHEKLGDAFNGTVLYDCEWRPITLKRYEVDEDEFTELIEEHWKITPDLPALALCNRTTTAPAS